MKTAKKRAPSISIRWQLMFFIGAMTLLTVGLIWGIITYALAPKYNATIRQNLIDKASAITAIFDQTDSEISNRDFGVLQLDDDFWTALGQTFSDKKINMDGYCVDFSDSTLRCLKAYESMFPCLLHESSGSFSGEFGYNLNTRQLITFRQELFEEGSLYKIVQIGSTRQMLVGQLSADGKYGIIVSTGMAQIATAAEVLRSILWPVALILLVLDLLFAIALPAIASSLLFNVGASSGGTDVIALIVEKYTHIHSIAVALFLTDLFMVVAACFVFNLYTALYSFVGLTVKSLVIDAVLERIKMCKAILIICDDKDPICNFVMRKLVRGATYTPCFGAYTDKPHYMIYTTLTNREAGQLQEFIHKENLNAFISMLSTTEVFGKGFNHA